MNFLLFGFFILFYLAVLRLGLLLSGHLIIMGLPINVVGALYGIFCIVSFIIFIWIFYKDFVKSYKDFLD